MDGGLDDGLMAEILSLFEGDGAVEGGRCRCAGNGEVRVGVRVK